MKAIMRRLRRLEEQVAFSPEPIRILCCYDHGSTDLAMSKCSRRYLPNGTLMEIVTLWGTGDDLSPEQLEEFIARFPIEPAPAGERHYTLIDESN